MHAQDLVRVGIGQELDEAGGVAQRTGATTYYLEIFPLPRDELDGRRPVLALYPSPGRVDLAVMSELVEAGRALENGFVSPERTQLIASTHRIYSIGEKSAMGDGRIDGEVVVRAARRLARRTVLADMGAAAKESGSVINAVLLGAIAGCGALPFAAEDFERAIRGKGVAVEANLRGFAAGRALAADKNSPRSKDSPAETAASPGAADGAAPG
ncbi:MAG: 2-oxoacid:acceptor oxidoreductase family protein, partial [Proteobacteria bacterium]|nr:2-oxoacid:acceptor oxidoreductase family protein [Pseudomonadota bacterium]